MGVREYGYELVSGNMVMSECQGIWLWPYGWMSGNVFMGMGLWHLWVDLRNLGYEWLSGNMVMVECQEQLLWSWQE